jgi:hypothetical protein
MVQEIHTDCLLCGILKECLAKEVLKISLKQDRLTHSLARGIFADFLAQEKGKKFGTGNIYSLFGQWVLTRCLAHGKHEM